MVKIEKNILLFKDFTDYLKDFIILSIETN